MNKREQEKEEAKKDLIERLGTGKVKFLCTVRRVAKSGMSRAISVFFIDTDLNCWNVSYLVSKITGERFDQKELGVSVRGCGMDMVWALMDDLSKTLYGKGGKINYQQI